ncbi:acyltransferase [Sulfuricella sp. T08]|uniref:acyltransferase family protein n=1 Tax=Sulfuricella sp. T08 TaxID=1632857 RepID=UPI000750DB4F|nr:acyltransferase [Sulfuricella sp. T08]
MEKIPCSGQVILEEGNQNRNCMDIMNNKLTDSRQQTADSRQQTADSRRIVFLDYLRIFAFVSVLIGHKFYAYVVALSDDPTVHSTPRFIANLLLPFLYGGGAGVVVFFLVSGYIIIHVLQTEQTGEFLIKRSFRIYPLYIVAVLAQYISLVAVGQQAPSLSTLLPQLLLVGDFFGTPYTLNGVEWTLRVEIAFYVFMAVLRSLNLLTNYKILPYVFVAATLLCGFIAPIPSADIWSKGYLTIYGPFLLLGSMFYLFEKKQIGFTFLLLFIGLVFYQYYSLMDIHQKSWLNAHFAILAFFIFYVSWAFRRYLTAAPWVLLLSDMTYAVYLFHNWFFDFAKRGLTHFSVSVFNPDVQALIALLLVCLFMVRYVEKTGILFGRALRTKLR